MKTHVIDGVTYFEVDRKAKVGDLVFVFDHSTGYPRANGIHTVDYVELDGHIHYGEFGRFPRGYRVLEPLESEEPTPDIADLLANLARRVSSLEQQLRDTQGNVERLAEELANTRHRVSKHAGMFGIVEERVEMLTSDIITLDERSQVINAINKFYGEGNR